MPPGVCTMTLPYDRGVLSARRIRMVACLVPALLFAALYLRALDYGFVWTDIAEFQYASILRPPGRVLAAFGEPLQRVDDFRVRDLQQPYYRPVQVVTASWLDARFGREPRTFRTAALVLGAVTAVLFAALALLAIGAPLPAQQAQLLDRELFFGDPEISRGQISPDGQFITFVKPYRGVMNIWVKRVDASFDDATPLTADSTRPVTGYFWAQDSRYVLFVQDLVGLQTVERGGCLPMSATLLSVIKRRRRYVLLKKNFPNRFTQALTLS